MRTKVFHRECLESKIRRDQEMITKEAILESVRKIFEQNHLSCLADKVEAAVIASQTIFIGE